MEEGILDIELMDRLVPGEGEGEDGVNSGEPATRKGRGGSRRMERGERTAGGWLGRKKTDSITCGKP
jgi:hypothetical protein